MLIDIQTKSGGFVMIAIEEKVAALQAVCNDPKATENDVSDASNDLGL